MLVFAIGRGLEVGAKGGQASITGGEPGGSGKGETCRYSILCGIY